MMFRSLEMPEKQPRESIFPYREDDNFLKATASNYQRSFLHKQLNVQNEIRDSSFTSNRKHQQLGLNSRSLESNKDFIIERPRDHLNDAIQRMEKHSKIARMVKDILVQSSAEGGLKRHVRPTGPYNTEVVAAAKQTDKLQQYVLQSDEKIIIPKLRSPHDYSQVSVSSGFDDY